MGLNDPDLFAAGGTYDKVAIAIERFKHFEPKDGSGFYLAFSGGKDSIVIYDLAVKSGVKFDAHLHLTSVDAPELLQFCRKHYAPPKVEWHRPEKTMWKLIAEKMMPPTRVVRYCCEKLKEGGGAGRIVADGVRWEESNRRAARRMFEQCSRKKTKYFLHPIIDWTADDVWEYIRCNDMPYCSLYDEGFKRIGCIGCPMAGDVRLKEFARWPQIEKAYKRAFDKIAITGIEANRKLHWKNGDDVFKWWMQENREQTDKDQCTLFE